MVRTVVLQLGYFFVNFHFPDYRNAPYPSTNSHAVSIAPNNTPSIDTPSYKYIVINIFYLDFFFCGGFFTEGNSVSSFLLNLRFTPLGTFKNSTLPFQIAISLFLWCQRKCGRFLWSKPFRDCGRFCWTEVVFYHIYYLIIVIYFIMEIDSLMLS